jgi:hypothetical protein
MSQAVNSTPLHHYVDAFNRRDADAMARIFAPDLQTIHPGEPEVDVISSSPFLARMQALWPKGIHYKLLRTIWSDDFDGNAEVWGELIALDAENKPLASELVVYKIKLGFVCEITVYKQMHPTHPAYQS